jgi:regulator of protease activity HflC (stomatin/prohibitin superfamily)
MKITVQAWEKGLKFRDGKFVGILEPGRYRLARWLAKDEVRTVDLRFQTMTIQGQEILTADKITVRLTVLAKYRVVDPAAAVMKVDNYVGQMYGDVQLALREAVAVRTLDELIVEKAALGAKVLGALQLTAASYGLELADVGVKDLILPGDLKNQFVRVIEARKKAEASQIERREEVSATRSLANTAQLLEKNPTLLKLKILESLEKIAQGGAKIVLPADFLTEKKDG